MSFNTLKMTYKEIIKHPFRDLDLIVFREDKVFFKHEIPKVGDEYSFNLDNPFRKVRTEVVGIENNIIYIKRT